MTQQYIKDKRLEDWFTLYPPVVKALQAIESGFDTIQDQLDSINSDTTSIDGKLDNLNITATVTGIESGFDTIEETLEEIKTNQTNGTQVIALPTGASTEAKQDTGNSSLSSIDGKLTTTNFTLQSQATATLQTDAINLLTTIDTDTGSMSSSLSSIDGKLTTIEDNTDGLESGLLTISEQIDLVSHTNTHTGEEEIRTYSASHRCLENSSDTPLAGNAVFTGSEWQDCLNYSEIIISVNSDKGSAVDGLQIQWSGDGTNIHETDEFTILANKGKTFSFPCNRQYIRLKYTNGAVAQGSFRLDTYLKRFASKGSSHRITDAIVGEDDAILCKSLLTGLAPDGSYKNVLVTNGGNQKISIEEFETDVSDNSNTQLKTSMYGKTGDTTFQVPRIDVATHTLQTIEYEHHEIHSGSHFFVKSYQKLSNNQVLDFTFVTPNTTKWTHFLWDIATESETNWLIYEGATITNALANAVTPLNSDRNSLTASVNTLRFKLQANLAGANADTDVTGATLIASGISGVGKGGQGVSGRDSEIILKQNTIYCFRAIATAAGYINFDMEWYEHTNRTA